MGDNVGDYVGKVGDRVGDKDLLSDVVKERKMEKHKIFQNKTRNSSSYHMNKQHHKKIELTKSMTPILQTSCSDYQDL